MVLKPTENEIKYRAKLKELGVEHSKLQRKTTYWFNKLKKEVENKYSHVKDMTIKNADWKLILFVEHPEVDVTYKKYNDLMHELGFFPGGYRPETNQRVIKIVLRKTTVNECIKKTMKSLKIILPYIEPIKYRDSNRKYKVIEIFCDHEGGIPVLMIKDDGKACVGYTRYNRFEFKTKWDTLKNTILWIRLHFPYEDDY